MIAGLSDNKYLAPKLTLFPVPAMGQLSISLENYPGSMINEVHITDPTGRSILDQQYSIPGHEVSISTEGWARGCYFVRVNCGSHLVYSKFVKD